MVSCLFLMTCKSLQRFHCERILLSRQASSSLCHDSKWHHYSNPIAKAQNLETSLLSFFHHLTYSFISSLSLSLSPVWYPFQNFNFCSFSVPLLLSQLPSTLVRYHAVISQFHTAASVILKSRSDPLFPFLSACFPLSGERLFPPFHMPGPFFIREVSALMASVRPPFITYRHGLLSLLHYSVQFIYSLYHNM